MHCTFLALAAAGLLALVQNTAAQAQLKYPAAPTSNQVDDYNGVKVADPYRPLENPDSPESRAWIKAENKITFDFLKTIPERGGIEKRLTEIWDCERFGVPFKEDGQYFFSKNTGLQNQNVIYTTTNFSEKPHELLDPNLLAKDGTIALGGLDVTDDARLMAYGLATAGSDWQQWKVRDVESGKDRTDLVDWVKCSNGSWEKDGSGFFYSRYDKPDEKNKLRSQVYNHKLFFHQLGTPQSRDKLIFSARLCQTLASWTCCVSRNLPSAGPGHLITGAPRSRMTSRIFTRTRRSITSRRAVVIRRRLSRRPIMTIV